MSEAEKCQRYQLLQEFNDLYEREGKLMRVVRRNHNRDARLELEQVSDQLEALRERIAGMSIDNVEVKND